MMMYEALGRLRWKAFLEASSADECDSVLDLTKELNEVELNMKLFDIAQQTDSVSVLNWYGPMLWFFAYYRVKYARYLPAYISEMDSLPITHPVISDSFWQLISSHLVVLHQKIPGTTLSQHRT